MACIWTFVATPVWLVNPSGWHRANFLDPQWIIHASLIVRDKQALQQNVQSFSCKQPEVWFGFGSRPRFTCWQCGNPAWLVHRFNSTQTGEGDSKGESMGPVVVCTLFSQVLNCISISPTALCPAVPPPSQLCIVYTSVKSRLTGSKCHLSFLALVAVAALVAAFTATLLVVKAAPGADLCCGTKVEITCLAHTPASSSKFSAVCEFVSVLWFYVLPEILQNKMSWKIVSCSRISIVWSEFIRISGKYELKTFPATIALRTIG